MLHDLDFISDKVSSLLAVAGDGGAGHGQLYPEIQLDGGVDNGIEAEDLLDAVRVLGVSPHADFRIGIMGHFGTPEEEGIGFGAVPQNDLCKDPSLYHQIEPRLLQFFLDAKYLVEDTRLFRIGLPKTEGQDLYLGPRYFGMIGKPLGRAFDLHPHVFEKRCPVRMVQPIEYPSADIVDNANEFNAFTFFFEPGAALVAGIGRKEGPVGGDDFIGKKSEQFGDLHQDMKDLIVKIFPQPVLEVGKGGFAGDVLKADPGVETVMPPAVPVPEHFHEGLHVRIFFDMPEQFQKEKTCGIIGDSNQGILMGDQGADEGEIYQ